MLINLSVIVCGGIIDNTQPGATKLELRTEIEDKTIRIRLAGNCLGEAAGRRATFEISDSNFHADPLLIKAYQSLLALIEGESKQLIIGDIAVLPGQGTHGASAKRDKVSIEFFHGRETRFLLESEECTCELSPGTRNPVDQDGEKQRILNLLTLRNHVAYNARFFNGSVMQMLGEDFPLCKWDYILNRAEGYNTIAQTLREKYPDTPRGRLKEAYVLDLIRYDTRLPLKEKRCRNSARKKPIRIPRKRHHDFTDFLLPREIELLLEVAKTPLYRATTDFTTLVHKQLVKLAKSNRDDQKSEVIFTHTSSISGQLLATQLLATDDQKESGLVQKRSAALLKRCTRLHRYTDYWDMNVREAYDDALHNLRNEIQNFMAFHNKNGQ